MKNFNERYDSYERLTECSGTDFSRDKVYVRTTLLNNHKNLSHRFHTDGVFNRIVTLKPRKALVGGHTIKVLSKDGESLTSASLELRTALANWEKKIQLNKVIMESLTWSRLYGGAVILINASGRSSRPLDLGSKGDFKLYDIIALDKSEVQVVYKNRTSTIDYYIHSDSGKQYHPDRVIHINGTICTRRELVEYEGFSVSVLNGVEPSLKHRDQLFKGISELVRVMGTKFIRIQDLTELLDTGDSGFKSLMKRINQVNRAMETSGLTPLALEESMDRFNLDFKGLPDMIAANNEAIAVNSGYPSSVLFMKQNSGAKATGNNEFTLYHDDVRWYQQTVVRPILDRIHKLFFAINRDKFEEQDLYVTFNQLNHSDPAEEATSFFNLTNAYGNLITHGVVSIAEIRSSLGSLDQHELVEIDPSKNAEMEKRELENPDKAGTGTPGPDKDPVSKSTNIGVKPEEL